MWTSARPAATTVATAAQTTAAVTCADVRKATVFLETTAWVSMHACTCAVFVSKSRKHVRFLSQISMSVTAIPVRVETTAFVSIRRVVSTAHVCGDTRSRPVATNAWVRGERELPYAFC